MVVAYHCSDTVFPDSRYWSQHPFRGFFEFGSAGVFSFFVLSGCIILAAHARDMGRPTAIKNYLVRRFIRVYPTYWALLLPLTTIYLLHPANYNPLLASHRVIANSFFLIGQTNHSSLSVAWTLFHEVAYYLLFSILILNKRLGAFALSTWWGLCVLKCFFPSLLPDHYIFSALNLLFMAGAFCYWLTKTIQPGRGFWIAGIGSLLFMGQAFYETQIAAESELLRIVIYGIASSAILSGLVWGEQTKPAPPIPLLGFLGDASYSIYLSHYPVLTIVAGLYVRLFGRNHPLIAFPCVILGTVAVGCLVHVLIERPLLKTLQAAWNKRKIAVTA